jgi:hypothetical protein
MDWSPPASKSAANRVHPTAKPVELIERALLNSSFLNQRALLAQVSKHFHEVHGRGIAICRCSDARPGPPTVPGHSDHARSSNVVR